MTADEAIARQLAEWQARHGIAPGDPSLALLEIFQVYLQHALPNSTTITAAPPSYAEFRETIELLDRRSKCFKDQSLDLLKEMRLFAQEKRRPKGWESYGALIVGLLAFAVGFFAGRFL